MYDDPPTPAGHSRPPRGQHCPGCGRLEPDLWARFCGVCGTTLGPAARSSAATVHLDVPGGTPTGRGAPAPPSPGDPYGGASRGSPPHGDTPYGGVQYGRPEYGVAPAGASSAGAPLQPAPGADRPGTFVYAVPSVGFAGPARLGAAVSAAFTLLPCVLFAVVGAWLIHAVRGLLDSWQTASVRIPAVVTSVNLTLNFIDLMQLRPIYDLFIYWDERLWMAFAILWLVPWALWIVAGALFAVLLAAIYNLIGRLGGGVRLTMQPTATPLPSTPGWAASPPPGAPPGAPSGWSSGAAGWPAEDRR